MTFFLLLLLPFIAAVIGYVALRSRRVPVWFDALIIATAAALPCIIWFRPEFVAQDASDLGEIRDMSGLLIPFWACAVGIPILFVGGLLRFLLFRRTHSDAPSRA